MSGRSVRFSRWGTVLAVLLAAALGGLAGSYATSKKGETVPVFTAVNTPQQGNQVSFADGFAPVVKQALPAVVNVSTSKVVRTQGGTNPFFSDPFFRQFFGGQSPNVPREQREHSLGSGVIFSPDGYIITNNHVVSGANDVKVLLGDKREFQAKVVGTDAKTDIAVLKIQATGLPVLPFGDSSKMQPGDFVLAIGNPFGLNQTVTMGIVSAIGRGGLGIEDIEDFIQTDASINPGNSGGALVNEQGQLIGINTAILSGEGGGNQGIGFAIPINMARHVMDQILKNGRVIRAWMGVVIQPVTPDIGKAFGLSEARGALIADIDPKGPAAKTGLQKGDVVLAVNNDKIQDSRDLQLKIAEMAPGTKVTLQVFRNGSTLEVPLTLGEMPASTGKGEAGSSEGETTLRGVSVENLTPDILQQLQLPPQNKGVVVDWVDGSSPAADAGLQRGDVIEQINRQPVTNVTQFQRLAASAAKNAVVLLINRGGTTTFLVVHPE